MTWQKIIFSLLCYVFIFKKFNTTLNKLSPIFSQWLVWLLPLFLHADQCPVLRKLSHQSDPLQPGVSQLPSDLLFHTALLLHALSTHTQEAPPPPDPPLHQHLKQPHPLYQHYQRDGILIGQQWNTLSHAENPSTAVLWLLAQLRQGNSGTGLQTVQYWGHPHFHGVKCSLWDPCDSISDAHLIMGYCVLYLYS